MADAPGTALAAVTIGGMRRPSALAALALAVGVLAPGTAADARSTPAPATTKVPTHASHHRAPPYLPDPTRPVPIPHAIPHAPNPVPMPHVRPRGPKPVPMPHAGEQAVPELRLPTR